MAEPVIEHRHLTAWDKAARDVLGLTFWEEEKDDLLSVEEFAEITRALVDEVHRLRQMIAIRRQSDRIAEQIEKGYR